MAPVFVGVGGLRTSHVLTHIDGAETAAIAEHLGLVSERCLPLPIQGLTADQRKQVAEVISDLG